ncbi:DUF6387 family protein [Pandoraea sp. B-6]|uniref:DUF6387 family protein n=1 Tax=Pandoraea sp. B-6 TaxID=1204340 RepID=UPI0003818362|nr:DUF6387 family protein [Pandoraea sp. B-6]
MPSNITIMGRPKKSDYISDDALAWFRLEKYAGLADAGIRKWAQLIFDRANLQKLADTPGNREYIRPLLKKLQDDPLCELGFGYQWKQGHPLDTASVRALTSSRLGSLTSEIAADNGDAPGSTAQNSSAVDELLLSHENPFSGSFLHLAVDLTATDAQLHTDFKAWLKAWRQHVDAKVTGHKYTTKIAGWRQSRVLQYFDLRLHATFEGHTVSREKFAELLDFQDRPSPKDLLDGLRKSADKNISFATFHALNSLSA